METEPNKPFALRQVRRVVALDPKDAQKTGILFECLAETNCPHCNTLVPLIHADPLSSLLCPSCGGKLMAPGRVGGFLLYEHIGEGEMGAIYRATDESLRRDVAVKLVRGCHADDPESRERLRREACAAGKLNHPRVAQVYALNFSNGNPYLVMELVTGQDFAQKLEREGLIDERVALRMALDVADGLSALNREGLVHGDIKPSNIVLDRDGNAKLVDFGLSGMKRLNSSGEFVGTPNYIAPELLRGAADTHRSDIYSLGATLYHLLSGRLTHEGETPSDVLKARLSHNPVPIGKHARHVSMPTRKLIMRMIELNPEKRPLSSDAVAADIREALSRLDDPAPVKPGVSVLMSRFFANLRLPRPHPSKPQKRSHFLVFVILGLIAVIAFLIAARGISFEQTSEWFRPKAAGAGQALDQTSEWFRRKVAGAGQALDQSWKGIRKKVADRMETATPPVSQPPREPAAPVRDVFTTEDNRIWQSMNLGEHTQRGSTLYMGGTMIIQGAGTGMWMGQDSCRFVWTKATGDYAFSAQLKAIAKNNGFAITGLLVKGADPALGPGLLFGCLGSGELFLQIRRSGNKTAVVKRSVQPVRIPNYLKLVRRGKTFEACVSADGLAWSPFAVCELDLPSGNAIGFTVSAEVPDTLATAKFADIRLLAPDLAGEALTGGGPTVPAPAAPDR